MPILVFERKPGQSSVITLEEKGDLCQKLHILVWILLADTEKIVLCFKIFLCNATNIVATSSYRCVTCNNFDLLLYKLMSQVAHYHVTCTFTCRPVDVKKGKKGSVSRTTTRFPVRSGPKQLAAYFNGQWQSQW